MLEVCIDNIDDVKLCNEFSDIIQRVEINQALLLGGLTPSVNFVKEVRKKLDKNIQLVSMIRIRSGNFVYSDKEFEIMYKDAENILKYTNGIAFGALTSSNELDLGKIKKMQELCIKNSKDLVFHRAIDIVENYHKAIQSLEKLKVKRILTSGHEKTAELGIENIEKIRSNEIEILVGCGISYENVNKFKRYDIHGSFSKIVESPFGSNTRLDREKLEKLRKTNIFKKSNIVFIHGAGITGKKIDGDSLFDFTDTPNLVDFKYNENIMLKKGIQNLLNLQLYGDDAVKYLQNYKFSDDDIKYVCGHSVGAYNVLKAYSDSKISEIDLIELGAPRIDEIEKYIEKVSKKAKFVLIEIIENDKLEFNIENVESIASIQYGDRSIACFKERFKDKKLPSNVFVLKIKKIKTKKDDYLSNTIENHSKLFKKNSKINDSFQLRRREIVELIRVKDKSISYRAKLKKIKELVDEYNSWDKI